MFSHLHQTTENIHSIQGESKTGPFFLNLHIHLFSYLHNNREHSLNTGWFEFDDNCFSVNKSNLRWISWCGHFLSIRWGWHFIFSQVVVNVQCFNTRGVQYIRRVGLFLSHLSDSIDCFCYHCQPLSKLSSKFTHLNN